MPPKVKSSGRSSLDAVSTAPHWRMRSNTMASAATSACHTQKGVKQSYKELSIS